MNFYSFENDKLNRKNSIYNLSDLSFMKTSFNENEYGYYMIPREYEMRMDLISNHLYGSAKYAEELMKLNNIINPFNIKEGDIIKYVSLTNIAKMHAEDEDKEIKSIDINKKQKTQDKQKKSPPPTSKPKSVKQVSDSGNNSNEIRIINNFKTNN